MSKRLRIFGVLLLLWWCLPVNAEEAAPWGEFIEPGTPFFSSVLDARELQGDWPEAMERNLIPRGLILPLDHGIYVCFDPDLLRIALVWQEDADGNFLSMDSMAAGSYVEAGRKAPGGQGKLPRPMGRILLGHGLHPGCRLPSAEPWEDPRKSSADPDEVGLGPLPVETHQFLGLLLEEEGVVLRYRVGDGLVSEFLRVVMGPAKDGALWLERNITVEGNQPVQFAALITPEGPLPETEAAPGKSVVNLALQGAVARSSQETKPHFVDWKREVRGTVEPDPPAASNQPYVIEKVPLPLPNPWNRNVRLAGFDFFSDGRAAFCTFDGDVWLARGIEGKLKHVRWRRFAWGLHEPMSLQIVKDEIYVFGRGGIWKLIDRDGDEVADSYEMFCNQFSQTAETREFANDMQKTPDGRFILAKAGQSSTTQGIHNGSILEVSADGKQVRVIAGGLRQPFIGYHAVDETITTSDQQGHWVPSTPLHVVQPGAHYGFIPTNVKGLDHPKPITEPLCWIPHFVNQSGASQMTNSDPRFGPLSGRMLHLGFNRPELFCVYPDGNQGAVASFLTGFDTGTLKMAVHPKDGQLYLTGFKIWGTVAERITGFYRVRYTGKGVLEVPEEVRSAKRGVLLRFSFPVDRSIASSFGSYNVDRWNYQRTSSYGSGHFKLDGSPGQESLAVSSIALSEDGQSVFLGIPDMQRCHQLRVTYRLPLPSELPQVRSAYLTIHELKDLDLQDQGFASNAVDLTPREVLAGVVQEPAAEVGEQLATALGCVACHWTGGAQPTNEHVGPTWVGLYGSRREFTDGTILRKVDEVYLRESILDPTRKVTAGYAKEGVGMPSYLGILQDWQIDSLILYIKTLQSKKK